MHLARVLFSTILLSTPLLAQTHHVAPPPKPTGSASASDPSLAVTMQFIQDKLTDLGTVNFTAFFTNTSNNSTGTAQISLSYTSVVADPSQCRVDYHSKYIKDGQTIADEDAGFLLRDVESIQVEPLEQSVTRADANVGNPNIVATAIQPATLELVVHRPHNVVNTFEFQDPDLADRVAKAITHAVELCGGGHKDPF
ncbi:MAG: hypothetical protein WBY53_06980 [Acidobacteriaceae bacterium]